MPEILTGAIYRSLAARGRQCGTAEDRHLRRGRCRVHHPAVHHHRAHRSARANLTAGPRARDSDEPGGVNSRGFYIHSPVDVHFWPMRKVLVDNRFHRIHHSLEPRHSIRTSGSASASGTAYSELLRPEARRMARRWGRGGGSAGDGARASDAAAVIRSKRPVEDRA